MTISKTIGDGEVTLDKTELKFTKNNFRVPQGVTLTGQEDKELDGDQSYEVTISSTGTYAQNADGSGYRGLSSTPYQFKNKDNKYFFKFSTVHNQNTWSDSSGFSLSENPYQGQVWKKHAWKIEKYRERKHLFISLSQVDKDTKVTATLRESDDPKSAKINPKPIFIADARYGGSTLDHTTSPIAGAGDSLFIDYVGGPKDKIGNFDSWAPDSKYCFIATGAEWDYQDITKRRLCHIMPLDGGDAGIGATVMNYEKDPVSTPGNEVELTFKKANGTKQIKITFGSAESSAKNGIYKYYLHLTPESGSGIPAPAPVPITMYDLATVGIKDGYGCVEEGSDSGANKYGKYARVGFKLNKAPKDGETLVVKGYLRFSSTWCETSDSPCSRGNPSETNYYRAYFSKLDGAAIAAPSSDESVLNMSFTSQNWQQERVLEVTGVHSNIGDGPNPTDGTLSDLKVHFKLGSGTYEDKFNLVRLDSADHGNCTKASTRSTKSLYQ